MRTCLKNKLKFLLYPVLFLLIIVIVKTLLDFSSPLAAFYSLSSDKDNIKILARDGTVLDSSYQNKYNTYDNILLHQVPELLTQSFVLSEDKRFFKHHGVDWLARVKALCQRITNNKHSRGASTITEQVVRMLQPRKRNYWSKWLEGLEAMTLEYYISKADILEFYLNQVPYSSNRRGIVQAARLYFDRSINTLNTKEMLSLVILVKAPSKFDLYKGKVQLQESISRLAQALRQENLLDSESIENLNKYDLALKPEVKTINSFHFANFIKNQLHISNSRKIITTIDSHLQQFTNDLLESRLESLLGKNINNAAAIIIDNQTNEVLAWVSVGLNCKSSQNQASGCMIDMVSSPRQPGSALKPFLYAAALEKNWDADTIIDDAPYSNNIGKGIKHFHNYNNSYYGKVRLRTALGNSLNIPALHTINYVTPEKYLNILHKLRFQNLRKGADFYDVGLALGNGEVSLYELARAYVMLANRGIFEQLYVTFDKDNLTNKERIYSEEVVSIIGNILSDPFARNFEFGQGSVLNLPVQTAVKTGTSTDYRDAWAMGYNHRYTVGIWMGNTSYSPTDGITGSLGPSLALRAIFNELNKNTQTASLFLSPNLVGKDICIDVNLSEEQKSECLTYREYFIPSKIAKPLNKSVNVNQDVRIAKPTDGLEMAMDRRIPQDKQAFEMSLIGIVPDDEVQWIVDDKKYSKIKGDKFLWPVIKGKHSVKAIIWHNNNITSITKEINFLVK